MSINFSYGFARVEKIIKSINNYDDIIGKNKLEKKLYISILQNINEKKYNEALNLFIEECQNKKYSLYAIPDNANVIYYGNTINNLKQLEFFKSKINFYPGFTISEIALNGININININDNIGSQIKEILIGFRGCQSMLSLIRQLHLYTISYQQFVESFSKTRANIYGLVIANDHSPNQVALSMVCKEKHISRLYLQHAEISPIFPELDFEYAILNDKNSIELYNKIGGSYCNKIAISRRDEFDERFYNNSVALLKKKEVVEIVIYLSSVFNEDKLKIIIEKLKTNRTLNFIGIKYHPQYADKIKNLTNAIKFIPEVPHIALVGNSSVALELVEKGNMVYIDMNLDDIPYDYYGFVRKGIALEGTVDLYGVPFFWKKAKEINISEISKRANEIDGFAQSKFFRNIYIDFFKHHTKKEAAYKMLSSIICTPKTFFKNAVENNPYNLNDFELIKAYEVLFLERLLPLSDCYWHLEQYANNSTTWVWFFIKKIEWNGYKPSDHEIKNLVLLFQSISHRKYKNWLGEKIIEILIRINNIESLFNLIKNETLISIDKLSVNKKISILKVQNAHNNQRGNSEISLYDYNRDPSLTDFDIFKIKYSIGEYDNIKRDDWVELEYKYLNLIPEPLRKEYESYFLPAYEKIRHGNKFIDVNLSQENQNNLLNFVKDSLVRRLPFSLIRLSDGEGYLFENLNVDEKCGFNADDARNRERHWWGEELSRAMKSKIIEGGLKAIRSANIIGVPTIYRILRDTTSRTVTFNNSLQLRGVKSVLNGIFNYSSNNAIFTDDKVNLRIFKNYDVLRELAELSTNIVIINGASPVDFEFKSDVDMSYIQIPTHNKQVKSPSGKNTDRTLPYLIDSLEVKIREAVKPGSLVLVGGGIAGKYFLHVAKECGGCALDLGSAFDELTNAGIHSLH